MKIKITRRQMGHIFISYSHKDKEYVHRLQAALQSEGFESWTDDGIDYGDEWPAEIEQRLDNCDAFIVIVSENAKKSKWVQNEVRRAERKNIPFFPLLLQGEPWLYIETIQWFDVTNGSLPDEKFFRRLSNFTKRNKSVDRASSLTTEKPSPPPLKTAKPVSHAKQPDQPVERRAINPTYAIIGSAILVFLLFIFGINYFGGSPSADGTPTETFTVPDVTVTLPAEATETQIPPTFTLEPPTFTPTPWIGSFIESDGVTMMYVPAGSFSMGSDSGDEKPIHSVDLNAYYIDKFEVTNAAYKRCVDAGTCAAPKESKSSTRSAYYSNPEFDEFPVIYVDWNMAKTYCEWRGDRLPTEAEWEKAARGTDGRTYPWGEDISCDKLNYNNCKGDTTKVGSYLDGVSPYGLYDMAGNVWEWVNDWYDEKYYQSSPSLNPLGADSGTYRVLRGGSWFLSDIGARSAIRNWFDPAFASSNFGFRCSRSHP